MYSRKRGQTALLSNVTTRLAYVDGLFPEASLQVGFLVAARQKTDNQSLGVKLRYNTADAGHLFGLGYRRKPAWA
jgi:hypothetical protein